MKACDEISSRNSNFSRSDREESDVEFAIEFCRTGVSEDTELCFDTDPLFDEALEFTVSEFFRELRLTASFFTVSVEVAEFLELCLLGLALFLELFELETLDLETLDLATLDLSCFISLDFGVNSDFVLHSRSELAHLACKCL